MTRPLDNTTLRIRIRDIAEMTGVSIGTVDRVLHNRGEVKGDTYERVMSVVRELGYTPNLLAKSLALKKDFHIAALIPEAGSTNPYWRQPLSGILRAKHELKDFNTYITVYGFDLGDARSFLTSYDMAMEGRPQGIVLAPLFQDEALQCLHDCEERQIPVILVDADLENGTRLACFGQDAHRSGEVAARLMHLALPEPAHVLILKMAWNKATTRHMQRREEGFRHGCGNGIKKLNTTSIDIDLSDPGEPDYSLKQVFGNGSPIDGIFVTNSRAHKVAEWLEKTGHQASFLIGYDLVDENLRYLRNSTIDFLICQKPEEQGYRSMMALYNHLLTTMPVADSQPSPIDILMKENLDSYLFSNESQSL
jgi:LacI family transcriptional regulator